MNSLTTRKIHSRDPAVPQQTNISSMADSSTVNALGYPVLEPAAPVPSDIEISQQICRNVGLLPIMDIAKQYVVVLCCVVLC
jgi:hypothetical protein